MLRSHKSLWISWCRTMIDASLNIITGLITLLTMGIVTYDLSMKYSFYCAKKDTIERMKNNN
jgi:hypothetical protein